jgi:MFS family permease
VGLTLGYSTFVVVAFGLFVRPLSDEFGWSRADISFALTVSSVMIVMLGPIVGRLTDKVGARRVLLPSIALFGVAISGFSLLTENLWHFYFMFFVMAVAGLGTLPSVYTRFIVDWFTKRRGIALGATLSGVGIGLIIGPPFIQHSIETMGWRGGYVVISGLILLVSWPTAYALLRDRNATSKGPEAVSSQQSGPQSGQRFGHPSSLLAFFRDRVFITLVTAFCLLGAVSVGLTAHLPSFFMDRGYSGEGAAGFMSLFGAAVIVGRLSCGVLIDRFFAPIVMSIFLTGMVVALGLLGAVSSEAVYMLAAVLLGLGFGAELDVMSYLVSRYFSFDRYAGIYAYVYSAFTVGAAVGPVLMGLCYDIAGNYIYGFWAFAVMAAIAIGLVLMLGPYRQGLSMGEAADELA